MGRPQAECGTDAGYYRHRRKKNEEPCTDCKTAHSMATRRSKAKPRRERVFCACGNGMHPTRDTCGVCRKQAEKDAVKTAVYSYTDDEPDPKRPVAWRPNGKGIKVPVYEQSEVA